jgi:hypothetical protein
MKTRVFIELSCEDGSGISAEEAGIAEDGTAEQVIELLKKDSKGRISRAIDAWGLAQDPEITVEVRGDHGTTTARWAQ